jgi:hypothetical protein
MHVSAERQLALVPDVDACALSPLGVEFKKVIAGAGAPPDRDLGKMPNSSILEFLDLGFGLTCGQNSVCQTEPKTEAASVCPNRTDIEGKPKTIFFFFFFLAQEA